MNMLQQENVSDLPALLVEFAGRVNEQINLRSALSAWQPEFYIQARDTGATFQVQFGNGRVAGVFFVVTEPGDDALLLRADNAILLRIFSGSLSPLGAYTDGLLEIYGSQKDQTKLDIIALVVWGA